MGESSPDPGRLLVGGIRHVADQMTSQLPAHQVPGARERFVDCWVSGMARHHLRPPSGYAKSEACLHLSAGVGGASRASLPLIDRAGGAGKLEPIRDRDDASIRCQASILSGHCMARIKEGDSLQGWQIARRGQLSP